MNWSRLFPLAEEYTGPKVPFYFLVLIAILSTVRSLIHMFAADGGAGVIAGIVLEQLLRIGMGQMKPLVIAAPPQAQLEVNSPLRLP